MIYHNLIIFVVLYFFLSILYRFVLIQSEKERQVRQPLPWIENDTFFIKVLLVEANLFIVKVFELLCIYADRFQSYIPLNFLIGFYVQQVPKLWSFPGHTTAKIDLKIYLRPMRIFLEILLITFFSSWVPP